MGLMQSQLSLHRVMQPGYLGSQAARFSSKRAGAVCSSGAQQIVFRSLAKVFLSLSAAYFNVLRTKCTMHRLHGRGVRLHINYKHYNKITKRIKRRGCRKKT